MVIRNSGRKPITDGPKKGSWLEGFCGRVTCQLQHRTALLGTLSAARGGCETTMIGNVVNDGRLFSLQPAEWLMLIGAA